MSGVVRIHLKDTREGTVIDRVIIQSGQFACNEIPVHQGVSDTLGVGEVLDLATLNRSGETFTIEVTDKAPTGSC
jgi:hypothetical protein